MGHFNSAVGSLETRVLVSARRFQDLSVTDDELPAPRQVESTTRSLGTVAGSSHGSELARIDGRPDRRAAPDEEAGDNTVAL